MTPLRPTAALLVIGNEILSGKIADTNTQRLAALLRRKGVHLRRAVTVPDDPAGIAAEVRALSAAHDHIFTSGGVGGTHDDVTMEGVAAAFGAEVHHAPEILAALAARGFGDSHRDLARAPRGARMVGRPGAWPVVVMRNVWVLPGLPAAFRRKLGIIEEFLPSGPRYFSDAVEVPAPEERLIPILNAVVGAWPDVEIGSYPQERDSTRITLDADREDALREAVRDLRARLRDAESDVHSHQEEERSNLVAEENPN